MTTYTDLNQKFLSNPLTRDIAVKRDVSAINQSIYNLINAKKGDFKFSDIEGPVPYLLFELMTSGVLVSTERQIKELLDKYEPRISVTEVKLEAFEDEKTITVSITYDVVETKEEQNFSQIVERLR